MDKVQLSFKEDELNMVAITYKDKQVLIQKYMPVGIQAILIHDYCELGSDSTILTDSRMIRAEIGLMLGLLDTMTNIDVKSTESYSFSLDTIVSDGTYQKILDKIENFDIFRDTLDKSIDFVLSEKYYNRSQGYYFDVLVAKVSNFIDKISEIDLDKESITKLVSTIGDAQRDFKAKWEVVEKDKDVENILSLPQPLPEISLDKVPSKRVRKPKVKAE